MRLNLDYLLIHINALLNHEKRVLKSHTGLYRENKILYHNNKYENGPETALTHQQTALARIQSLVPGPWSSSAFNHLSCDTTLKHLCQSVAYTFGDSRGNSFLR